MIISPAFAQAATEQAAPGAFSSIFPLLIVFIIFYLLVIRPQHKKFKQHELLIKGLKKGDAVVTGGGIIATITKVSEDSPVLSAEIADGVEVQLNKHTIVELTEKPKAEKKAAPKKKSAPKKEKKS